ncbi:hypothetical protein GCM10009785_08450 [Brooklawnia cerclae]|uniref:DNA-binding transcriptional regulator of glucitol operon n=1 Tax=Brooklawnia cerclae TaxID=349934 RepID=A0ABX0SJ47_9ACTN|nr:transcriptional regulator GutM [Brooklawnia cerclae]NIH58422.1 DNA-binding transcriptional regulator of glucitol operon [Brooklawnia cerclae]
MSASDWVFPAILIAAMVLGVVLTFFQQRAYSTELNTVLRLSKGRDEMLVSGRGRSFRGGSIVIMLVDAEQRRVTWASAMNGISVFARFRPVPALLGAADTAVERAEGKQFKQAVEMAVAQLTARSSVTPETNSRFVRRKRPQ